MGKAGSGSSSGLFDKQFDAKIKKSNILSFIEDEKLPDGYVPNEDIFFSLGNTDCNVRKRGVRLLAMMAPSLGMWISPPDLLKSVTKNSEDREKMVQNALLWHNLYASAKIGFMTTIVIVRSVDLRQRPGKETLN